MCQCRADCFGGCCGLLLLILVCFTMGMPWYYIGTEYDSSVTGGDKCNQFTLFGWEKIYCSDDCDNFLEGQCLKSSISWSDLHANEVHSKFKTTVGLYSIAFLCTFFGTIGLMARWCCSQDKGKKVWVAVILGLGLFFTIVAVGYFAGQLPKAFKKQQGGVCDYGPCDKFAGEKDDGGSKGGAGWYGAVFAIPTTIAVMIAALKETAPVVGTVQYQPAYGAAPPPGSYQGTYASPQYGQPQQYGQQVYQPVA